jgi:hypothetical protein
LFNNVSQGIVVRKDHVVCGGIGFVEKSWVEEELSAGEEEKGGPCGDRG